MDRPHKAARPAIADQVMAWRCSASHAEDKKVVEQEESQQEAGAGDPLRDAGHQPRQVERGHAYDDRQHRCERRFGAVVHA
jgi:hypothetical protein